MGALAPLLLLAASAAGIGESAESVLVVRSGAALGAAVVLEDGRVITAAHVVAGHDTVEVEVDGEPRTATVLRRSVNLDLAELDVDTSGVAGLVLAEET